MPSLKTFTNCVANELSGFAYNTTTEDLVMLVAKNGTAFASYNTAKRPNVILPPAVIFTCGPADQAGRGYTQAQALKAYIEKHGLGVVTVTPCQNSHHEMWESLVFVWAINHDTMKTWREARLAATAAKDAAAKAAIAAFIDKQ